MTIAFPMVIVNNSMIDAIQKTRPSERLKSCDDEVLLFTAVEFTVELHISIICVKSETCKINEFVICGNLRISHTSPVGVTSKDHTSCSLKKGKEKKQPITVNIRARLI